MNSSRLHFHKVKINPLFKLNLFIQPPLTCQGPIFSCPSILQETNPSYLQQQKKILSFKTHFGNQNLLLPTLPASWGAKKGDST